MTLLIAPVNTNRDITEHNTIVQPKIELPEKEKPEPKKRTYGSLASTEKSYREIIAEYEDWDTETAYAIMMAESGGDPNAVNWDDYHPTSNTWGSFGLFQLAEFHGNNKKLKDPRYNIEKAHKLWEQQGWEPWGAYQDGRYLS